jgi:hypothetical protein
MGLFSKAKRALGIADRKLLASGVLDLHTDVPPAPIILVGDDGRSQ